MTAAATSPGAAAWSAAIRAASLFAVDPVGLGGIAVRASAGPVRDQFLAALGALLPEGTPMRRVPLDVPDGRLLGGLDLAATLRVGRPVAERGLLAEADGGIAVLAMAERASAATAGRLAATLDTREVVADRDGIAQRHPARLGLVALDEGLGDDERLPAALVDRFAFLLDLNGIRLQDTLELVAEADEIDAARGRLAAATVSPEMVEALCATALTLGVDSLRASLLAVRAATVAAALDGRTEVAEADAVDAARLVLSPRATRLPPTDEAPEEPAEPPPDTSQDQPPPDEANDDPPDPQQVQELADVVLAAAAAATPPGLLASLAASLRAPKGRTSGRVGALRLAQRRGRPVGVRRGSPAQGGRLHLLETLRAAAPWQSVRAAERRDWRGDGEPGGPRPLVDVRREDFRIVRYKQRTQTTTIFVVDASGSAALNRLAETKGAVELLLAECYVRRDRVAVIAFRGRTAETLLPPTRSLVRAKRGLAGLPGGGGTPLAAGIEAATTLAEAIRRQGETPVVVLLTDGRGNVARDGSTGRDVAEADALGAARQLRLVDASTLLIDTATRPQPAARRLASEMGARYLPLPQAGSGALADAVRTAGGPP